MVIGLLIVFGSTLALFEYSNYTIINMSVTGSPHVYFDVVYGSTNVTLPEAQNAVVQVPPHASIIVYAYPDPSYYVVSWKVSGAEVTDTGQDSVGIETGAGGSSIALAVVLSNNSTNS